MGDLALYIHIPFCRKKCVYCDFYSITELSRRPRYVAALCTEIDRVSRSQKQESAVNSIYFGGGTPSLLSQEDFSRIFSALRAGFKLASDVEISCEANPGTLDPRRLLELRRAGINRLTIGVQSFRDSDLQILGRIHDAETARQAIV